MSRQLLNISRDGDSTTSLGKLCQCSVTPTVKKCFLPHVFQFVPLPLVLSLDISEKSLALSSFHPPFGYLHTLMRSPLSLFISRLNSPIFLSLSPQKKCSSSLNILAMAFCWSWSNMPGSEESGRITSLHLLAVLFPAQDIFGCFCWRDVAGLSSTQCSLRPLGLLRKAASPTRHVTDPHPSGQIVQQDFSAPGCLLIQSTLYQLDNKDLTWESVKSLTLV